MDKALIDSVLQLKPAERMRLLNVIYRSLEQPDTAIDEIWYDEAERRLAAHESGVVKGIPADQVECVTTDPAEAAPRGPADSPAAGRGYSVSEFSDMTYLTPFGVTEWLKKGILSGSQDEDGNWSVDAANLESDRIKRLRRC